MGPHRRTRPSTVLWPAGNHWVLALVVLSAAIIGAPAQAAFAATPVSVDFHRPSPEPPTATVGAGPYGVAMDARQQTAFVATAEGVSVVDITHCTALDNTGCGTAATTFPIGGGNIGILFDRSSHMVYVASAGTNTVVLFSERHCNAQDMSGCGRHVRQVHVGSFPTDLALDRRSSTLYVSNAGLDNPGDTLSMIDTAKCNAHVAAGCDQVPPTVKVGNLPAGMAVDPATRTLYVTTLLDNSVSVLNTNTCNAQVHRGCRQSFTTPVGNSPAAAIIDHVSNTLYVANLPADVLGTLSLIDTTRCNAQVNTGCSSDAPTARIGSVASGLAADPSTRTLYVANQEDSSVSAIDEIRCNAQRTDGCLARPPSMRGGFDAGGVGVDTVTHTVYLVSQDENTLTVLNGNRCNGQVRTGCTRATPKTRTGVGPSSLALDPSTNTLYVPNQIEGTVSVVDASRCSAARLAGCRQTWPKISVGAFPKTIVINSRNHTAYVANYEGNSVSVIDLSTCNAHRHDGCANSPREISVPGGTYTLTLSRATRTVFVAGVDSGLISIIDTRSCNALRHSGCSQTPPTAPVGLNPAGLATNSTTNTLYVTDRANGVVDVVDMTTCNGADSTDCTVVATAPVGTTPRFMAHDRQTHTLYVANRDDDTLSMINTDTCNAGSTDGCLSASPIVSVGHLPYGIAINQRTHRVYVGEVGDSTIREINGRRCNSVTQSGCARQLTAATGGWPTNIAVDRSNGTAYVSDNVDADVSIVRMTRPACSTRRLK